MFTPRKTLTSLLVSLLAVLAMSGSASAASYFGENSTKIDIPLKGQASPYGSPITVSGQPGRITDVYVTLRGVDHGRVSDLDFLLVSPDGETSVVMAGSCFGYLRGRNMTFNQSSLWPLVPGTAADCGVGPYRPTQRGAGEWPAPAPLGPHGANFDRFIGDNPNGTWKLYVNDDRTGYLGEITNGWTLGLQTEEQDLRIGYEDRADPYPSTRTVSGLNGLITDVDVTLPRIFHERLSDLDLLLVGPTGQKTLLMSDACQVGRAKDVTFTWDDDTPRAMDVLNCAGGRYQPTDYDAGDTLPAPAPAGPYGTTLTTFDQTDPNGEWKLYAVDDDPFFGEGFVVNRFQLDITTRPRAKVALAGDAFEVPEGESRTITLLRSGAGALAAGSVKVTTSPFSATSGTDYKPIATTVEFAAGETQKTFPIEALADDAAENPETFKLEVSGATGDAELGTPAAALVTIRDVAPRVNDQPGGGGGGGGGAQEPEPTTPDRTAPGIGAVTLKPAKFAVTRGKARRARGGTTIRYSLSEAASVTLQVERRVGRRWRRAASLKQSGRPGVNRKAFSGRVGRKALRRGTYRLVVVAVDAAGNRATAKPRRFQIVKP
jgi:subtilisin-like proprotein convertase family protein